MDFFKEWKLEESDSTSKDGAQAYAEDALSLQLSHPNLDALITLSSLLLASKLDVVLDSEIWEDFTLPQKNHFRNAICYLVEFFSEKGLFNEQEGKSISYAGLSNTFTNLYRKNELPSIVIIELTKTGYFSVVKTSRQRRDTAFYQMDDHSQNPALNTPKNPSVEEITDLFHKLADKDINQIWHHLNLTTWFSAFKQRLNIPEGAHLSMKEVTDKIDEELNKESNHPISASEKQQIFNDITIINTNLSKKANTSLLVQFMSSLVFLDGSNRQFFLDATKEFFFQRNLATGSELEFFYLDRNTMSKTAFFQIKPDQKKILFDQQVEFNLVPKVAGKPLSGGGGGLTLLQENIAQKRIDFLNTNGGGLENVNFHLLQSGGVILGFSQNYIKIQKTANAVKIVADIFQIESKNGIDAYDKVNATLETQFIQKHQLDSKNQELRDDLIAELEHVEDASGFHTIFNQHFEKNELDGRVKQEGDLSADWLNNDLSVNIESNVDWLKENSKYIIELTYEYPLSNKERNLNTLKLWFENVALGSWKYLWRYGGGWNPNVSNSAAVIGSGWVQFSFQRSIKFILEIDVWNNQDGTRNYSIVVKTQNQKESNLVNFRAWATRKNEPAANFVKNISLISDSGLSADRFEKPEHLNIKIQEQIHH